MLRMKEAANSTQEKHIMGDMTERGYKLIRRYQKGKKYFLVFETENQKNKSS